MFKAINRLPKTKKIAVLTVFFLLSAPAGAFIGAIIGLMATTFMPQCCHDYGCRNCFEFKGLVGYEALAVIGFLAGLFLGPIVCLIIIIYLFKKNKINTLKVEKNQTKNNKIV